MSEIRLEITAGAGGPEAQAWAAMVLHMYIRWAARHGYQIKPGREIKRTDAGIQGAALTVEGDGVKRLLAEDGIHRLVRISPFDAGARRHTSFVAVDVNETVQDHIVERPWHRSPSAFERGQVRSYVLTPYKIAKDLRTGITREDVDSVLDGDIDDFLDGAEAAGLPHKPDPDAPAAATMD